MIKAIIFDYGKVISYAKNTGVRGEMARAYGVDEAQIKEALSHFMEDFRCGKISEDTFWEKVSHHLKKPVPQNKYELWRKGFSEKLVIFEEMLEYVKALKSKGYKVAVVSNNIQPFVDIIRERKGFEDFDVVINSCEVGYSKPDAEIFKVALERLDLPPEEVIFIDDKEENLETAKTLGMKTILAENSDQIKSSINAALE